MLKATETYCSDSRLLSIALGGLLASTSALKSLSCFNIENIDDSIRRAGKL